MVHPLAQLYLPFIVNDYRDKSTRKYGLIPYRSQILVEWVVGRSDVQRQREQASEWQGMESAGEGIADGGWPMVRFYLPN